MLSFNVIVVSVVLWYWTHTQKLQAMSLNDRSEGRQSKRSSPIKVIDTKYYKHVLIIIYLFLFLGKNLADFINEKHVSNKNGGALYYMWMLPSKVIPYHLWRIHRLYSEMWFGQHWWQLSRLAWNTQECQQNISAIYIGRLQNSVQVVPHIRENHYSQVPNRRVLA